MGEHADYLIDQMIGGHWNSHHRKSRGGFHKGIGRGMWRSAGGVIAMSEMTDDHIKNAIRLCESTGNNGKKAELNAELKRRNLEKNPHATE